MIQGKFVTLPVGTFKNYKRAKIKKARELYSPFPYRCIRAYRIIDNKSICPTSYVLCRPWEKKEEYIKAATWITETGVGRFNTSFCLTDRDRSVYFYVVDFNTEGDKLMFLLRFPEFA